jgi:hypothetical protein
MSPFRVRIATVALGAMSALAAVAPVAAQVSRETLPDGARLRIVDTASRKIEFVGDFVRWVGDTMVVVRVGTTEQSVRLRRWNRIDVSLGRHQHVVRNGLIGAAAGAVVLGAVVAASVNPEPTRSDTCLPLGPEGSCWGVTVSGTPREQGAAVGAAYGSVLGGLVGGITGLFPREKWVVVGREVRITVAPGVRGPAALVTFAIGSHGR